MGKQVGLKIGMGNQRRGVDLLLRRKELSANLHVGILIFSQVNFTNLEWSQLVDSLKLKVAQALEFQCGRGRMEKSRLSSQGNKPADQAVSLSAGRRC